MEGQAQQPDLTCSNPATEAHGLCSHAIQLRRTTSSALVSLRADNSLLMSQDNLDDLRASQQGMAAELDDLEASLGIGGTRLLMSAGDLSAAGSAYVMQQQPLLLTPNPVSRHNVALSQRPLHPRLQVAMQEAAAGMQPLQHTVRSMPLDDARTTLSATESTVSFGFELRDSLDGPTMLACRNSHPLPSVVTARQVRPATHSHDGLACVAALHAAQTDACAFTTVSVTATRHPVVKALASGFDSTSTAATGVGTAASLVHFALRHGAAELTDADDIASNGEGEGDGGGEGSCYGDGEGYEPGEHITQQEDGVAFGAVERDAADSNCSGSWGQHPLKEEEDEQLHDVDFGDDDVTELLYGHADAASAAACQQAQHHSVYPEVDEMAASSLSAGPQGTHVDASFQAQEHQADIDSASVVDGRAMVLDAAIVSNSTTCIRDMQQGSSSELVSACSRTQAVRSEGLTWTQPVMQGMDRHEDAGQTATAASEADQVSASNAACTTEAHEVFASNAACSPEAHDVFASNAACSSEAGSPDWGPLRACASNGWSHPGGSHVSMTASAATGVGSRRPYEQRITAGSDVSELSMAGVPISGHIAQPSITNCVRVSHSIADGRQKGSTDLTGTCLSNWPLELNTYDMFDTNAVNTSDMYSATEVSAGIEVGNRDGVSTGVGLGDGVEISADAGLAGGNGVGSRDEDGDVLLGPSHSPSLTSSADPAPTLHNCGRDMAIENHQHHHHQQQQLADSVLGSVSAPCSEDSGATVKHLGDIPLDDSDQAPASIALVLNAWQDPSAAPQPGRWSNRMSGSAQEPAVASTYLMHQQFTSSALQQQLTDANDANDSIGAGIGSNRSDASSSEGEADVGELAGPASVSKVQEEATVSCEGSVASSDAASPTAANRRPMPLVYEHEAMPLVLECEAENKDKTERQVPQHMGHVADTAEVARDDEVIVRRSPKRTASISVDDLELMPPAGFEAQAGSADRCRTAFNKRVAIPSVDDDLQEFDSPPESPHRWRVSCEEHIQLAEQQALPLLHQLACGTGEDVADASMESVEVADDTGDALESIEAACELAAAEPNSQQCTADDCTGYGCPMAVASSEADDHAPSPAGREGQMCTTDDAATAGLCGRQCVGLGTVVQGASQQQAASLPSSPQQRQPLSPSVLQVLARSGSPSMTIACNRSREDVSFGGFSLETGSDAVTNANVPTWTSMQGPSAPKDASSPYKHQQDDMQDVPGATHAAACCPQQPKQSQQSQQSQQRQQSQQVAAGGVSVSGSFAGLAAHVSMWRGNLSPQGQPLNDYEEALVAMYHRHTAAKQRLEAKNEQYRAALASAELQDCSFKPQVSPGSRKLLRRRGGSPPPYLRPPAWDGALPLAPDPRRTQRSRSGSPGPSHHSSPFASPGRTHASPAAHHANASPHSRARARGVTGTRSPTGSPGRQRLSKQGTVSQEQARDISPGGSPGPDVERYAAALAYPYAGSRRRGGSPGHSRPDANFSGPSHPKLPDPSDPSMRNGPPRLQGKEQQGAGTTFADEHHGPVLLKSCCSASAGPAEQFEDSGQLTDSMQLEMAATDALSGCTPSTSVLSASDMSASTPSVQDMSTSRQQAHQRLYEHAWVTRHRQQLLTLQQAAEDAAAREFRARSPGRSVLASRDYSQCGHVLPPVIHSRYMDAERYSPGGKRAPAPSGLQQCTFQPVMVTKQRNTRAAFTFNTVPDVAIPGAAQQAFDDDKLQFLDVLYGKVPKETSSASLYAGDAVHVLSTTHVSAMQQQAAARMLAMQQQAAARTLAMQQQAAAGHQIAGQYPHGYRQQGRAPVVEAGVCHSSGTPTAVHVDWREFQERQHMAEMRRQQHLKAASDEVAAQCHSRRSISPGTYRILNRKQQGGEAYVPPQHRPLPVSSQKLHSTQYSSHASDAVGSHSSSSRRSTETAPSQDTPHITAAGSQQHASHHPHSRSRARSSSPSSYSQMHHSRSDRSHSPSHPRILKPSPPSSAAAQHGHDGSPSQSYPVRHPLSFSPAAGRSKAAASNDSRTHPPFTPQITQRAARMPAASLDALHDGGRAARAAWLAATHAERAAEEAAQQWGQLAYKARPNPHSLQSHQGHMQRVSLSQPGPYLAAMAAKRKALEAQAAAAAAAREASELSKCTFWPATNRMLPAYLTKTHAEPQHSMHMPTTQHSPTTQEIEGLTQHSTHVPTTQTVDYLQSVAEQLSCAFSQQPHHLGNSQQQFHSGEGQQLCYAGNDNQQQDDSSNGQQQYQLGNSQECWELDSMQQQCQSMGSNQQQYHASSGMEQYDWGNSQQHNDSNCGGQQRHASENKHQCNPNGTQWQYDSSSGREQRRFSVEQWQHNSSSAQQQLHASGMQQHLHDGEGHYSVRDQAVGHAVYEHMQQMGPSQVHEAGWANEAESSRAWHDDLCVQYDPRALPISKQTSNQTWHGQLQHPQQHAQQHAQQRAAQESAQQRAQQHAQQTAQVPAQQNVPYVQQHSPQYAVPSAAHEPESQAAFRPASSSWNASAYHATQQLTDHSDNGAGLYGSPRQLECELLCDDAEQQPLLSDQCWRSSGYEHEPLTKAMPASGHWQAVHEQDKLPPTWPSPPMPPLHPHHAGFMVAKAAHQAGRLGGVDKQMVQDNDTLLSGYRQGSSTGGWRSISSRAASGTASWSGVGSSGGGSGTGEGGGVVNRAQGRQVGGSKTGSAAGMGQSSSSRAHSRTGSITHNSSARTVSVVDGGHGSSCCSFGGSSSGHGSGREPMGAMEGLLHELTDADRLSPSESERARPGVLQAAPKLSQEHYDSEATVQQYFNATNDGTGHVFMTQSSMDAFADPKAVQSVPMLQLSDSNPFKQAGNGTGNSSLRDLGQYKQHLAQLKASHTAT